MPTILSAKSRIAIHSNHSDTVCKRDTEIRVMLDSFRQESKNA